LESLSIVTLRQIVGGVVLAVTISIILFRPTPRHRVHPAWAAIAFPLSGFLQGIVGMGGPPMVFWVQAHDWGTRQMRAFMFAMYLMSIAPAIAVLYAFFGNRVVEPAVVASLALPLLLFSTALGLRLGTWLGRHRLRKVTLTLLVVIGLAGLASPWMTGG
jgi:uncharacterized membrane protein YfcA